MKTLTMRDRYALALGVTVMAIGCGPIHPVGQGGAGGCTGENCGGAGGAPGGAGGTDPMDAGLDAELDSGVAPAPPPGCLPPCLEDAIRRCVPTFDACLVSTETAPTEPTPTTVTRTCDPVSGWKVVEVASYPTATRTLYQDGQECFARSTYTRNVGGIALEVTYYSFGNEVATGAELQGTRAVMCGDAGVFRLDDVPSADCARWRALLTPTPTCASTSAGVCE